MRRRLRRIALEQFSNVIYATRLGRVWAIQLTRGKLSRDRGKVYYVEHTPFNAILSVLLPRSHVHTSFYEFSVRTLSLSNAKLPKCPLAMQR